jgi:alcohol dehydrogenase class IV
VTELPYQDSYSFFSPTRLVVGRGSRSQIPDLLSQKEAKRPLIVTDKGLVGAGVVELVTAHLDAAGITYAMYDGVLPNPPIKVVEECVHAYSEGACDSLIIVGGGSSIDTAKCAGVIASNGGEIASYFGAGKVKDRMPFTIAIPTTYGTGSEVTPFAVITDDENFKDAVRGDEIIPNVGLLDSDLAVRLPLPVAAATGMDAMTHAIESYVANTSNAIADASALQAIRMVAENIRQAASSDHNHDATEQMLVASALAGVAFSQTLLGNVHAMSHPVSGHYGVPHGVANAILLPHIMDFNLLACPDRFADIASALGEDIDGLSDTEAAEVAVDAVETLNDELGIPADLTEAGARRDGIPKMAKDAMKSINIQLNPRTTSLQNVITLYEETF